MFPQRGKNLALKDSLRARDRLRMRHPDFHQQPRRQFHRHERRRHGDARFQADLFDVNRDVNQTAAIVYEGKSSWPQIHACSFSAAVRRRISCSRPSRRFRKSWASQEKGHDYFLQCTDARPDTGGFSGATPAEAVSWGKVDPDTLAGLRGCLR